MAERVSTLSISAFAGALNEVTPSIGQGGCALVVRSTVDTAIATQPEVIDAGVSRL